MIIEICIIIQTIIMGIFIYLYYEEEKRKERIYKDISLLLYKKLMIFIKNNMKDLLHKQ